MKKVYFVWLLAAASVIFILTQIYFIRHVPKMSKVNFIDLDFEVKLYIYIYTCILCLSLIFHFNETYNLLMMEIS